MKHLKIILLKFLDLVFSPLTLISSIWLRFIRRRLVKFWGNDSIISKIIFTKIGVFPIIDHYYEPLFNHKRLKYSLRLDRQLNGIDFNISEQLSLLKKFNYNDELKEIGNLPENKLTFSFSKGPFGPGDTEYLYNIIRLLKPKKIIEIGSGHSTLITQHALTKNSIENKIYHYEHICIEPYENLWLEKLPIRVIRKLVEDVDINFFKQLNENDILFIDSSHIIRPQGDVLFEYLQILPSLNNGVIVHIHDIFTPKDYPNEWIINGNLFWNEQYLLESFLSLNNSYKIIGALNYIKHNYYNELAEKCPMLTKDREPGSFWIKKTN
ncbi:MAG: class I SAM-dependent methyltransferase [Bacteroidales bacterium]|nr:class I SAM-dependent methyltransferase [Bacteroidales bacterium]